MVIIESDPAEENELLAINRMYVMGSALEDSVMEKLSVGSARAGLLPLPTPTTFTSSCPFVKKEPTFFVYARGDSEAGLPRLRLAGATQTLSAYQCGCMRIAASILRPSVSIFSS
jgi:hypothetical protein